LHLRSGTRNYRGKNAAELYKGRDISQKLKIPPKNRRYVATPSNETEGIDVDPTSDSAREVVL
jgi:hypothetical protein